MRRAVDLQLKTQQAMGQLEPVDEGLKAMARTLADAWDAEVADRDGSRYTEATIAGRMLPVLLELRGERHDSASDIAWDAELEQLKATIRDAARSRQDDDRA
jgi:hypothetical protein